LSGIGNALSPLKLCPEFRVDVSQDGIAKDKIAYALAEADRPMQIHGIRIMKRNHHDGFVPICWSPVV
jgi:hypothetical protein